MTFNAKKLPAPQSSGKRPDPMEAGSYPARLVQLVSLGIQTQRPFKGETKPPRLMVRLTYEFLDEFMKDEDGKDLLDKPRWLSEEIPFMSLKQDLATSTKRYYALDPEDNADGDWTQLVGSTCMVTVVTEQDKRPGNDRIYEKISAVSAMRPKEAAKAPELKNAPVIWDFYTPDLAVFQSFPDWIQEKIKGAVDFEGSRLSEALGGVKGAPVTKPAKEAEAPAEAAPEAAAGEEGKVDW